jgi:hypothetical protein
MQLHDNVHYQILNLISPLLGLSGESSLRTANLHNGHTMTVLNLRNKTLDIKSPNYHVYQKAVQDGNVSKWLKTKGISLNAMEKFDHTIFYDITTLVLIKDKLHHRMIPKEQEIIDYFWKLVYTKHRPLNDKFWKRLNKITTAIDLRDHLKTQKQIAFNDKRKSLKNN